MMRGVRFAGWLSLSLFSAVMVTPDAKAQANGSEQGAEVRERMFPLGAAMTPEAGRELVIVLHNVLPSPAKAELGEDQSAVVVSGTPEQLRLAAKVIDDLRLVSRAGPHPATSEVFSSAERVTVHKRTEPTEVQVVDLPSTMSAEDEKELFAALRESVDPETKMYILDTLHKVVVNSTAEQLTVAVETVKRVVPAVTERGSFTSTVYKDETPSVYTDRLVEQTFYLPAGTDFTAANEVLVAMRNILTPSSRVALAPSRAAVVVAGTPSELALAGAIVAGLYSTGPQS